MSPRRRLLVAILAALVLVAAVVVGARVAGSSGPAVDVEARPAQDRPGPVLLVPGYGGGRDSLLRLADRIRATGRDAQVLTLVGDGTGDLSAQVQVLDDAVDAALAAGAPSVDVVGYSAGGVVAGLWVARDDGAAKARRIVTLGSPLNGTTLAAVAAAQAPDACPTACRQLAPGSAELAELARARVGSALPWLSVWTGDDETSTPPDTANLPGAVDVPVQQVCPGARVTHSGLPTDPTVAGLVLRGIATQPIDLTGAGCGTAAAP
ncbi:esterase/lipase family protein [Pseudonocardia lutea]|uniref:Esterase/lipase family protein n=1 Tax=Pseudonocardia lutea TaxID=2172015 RepID=A0ABW1IEV3_9PSEU